MRINVDEVASEVDFSALSIKNLEDVEQRLPSRAFKRVYGLSNAPHINEVVLNVKREHIGKDADNSELEEKLKKASTKDEVNIVTFFGGKDVDLKDLLKYRDVGLLASFESLYNDHLVSLPFSLKFRQEDFESEKINKEIMTYLSDFIGSSKNKRNILGYVPAFSWYRDIEKLVEFYSDKLGSKAYGTGNYTYVPLLIDYKSCNVDRFKRATIALNELKKKYMEGGYYLMYYGLGISTPRMGIKKQVNTNIKEYKETLAKEFLLSFLGFDIIGSSHAKPTYPRSRAIPPEPKRVGEFSKADFFYYPTKEMRLPQVQKVRNLEAQNEYLDTLSTGLIREREMPIDELRKRKDASDYVNSY